MNRAFSDESTDVARNYIRTIAFIDDEVEFDVKNTTNDHLLDANDITKRFADAGKSCTFFKMQSADEKNSIVKLLQNSDVCILDWKLTFPGTVDNVPEDQLEEDIEDDEGRGKHAKKLLREIIANQNNSPKLIVIYTAERDTGPIYDSVRKIFSEKAFQENEDELWVQTDRYRIIICLKPQLSNSHNGELAQRSIPYAELPQLVYREFAHLTGGLVSNVVLRALTALKDNSNRLMQLYNKKLDPAFLAHRAMLSVPDDAEELFQDTLTNSIKAVISYSNVTQGLRIEQIENCIDQQGYEEKDIVIFKKNNKIRITNDERKAWHREGYKKFIPSILKNNEKNSLNEKQLEEYERHEKLFNNALDVFISDNHKDINEEFAILTHHKSNLLHPSYLPQLTLGTVVRLIPERQYWLCIQQRCDSVRLEEDKSRSFLFLPLVETEKRFDIIYKNSSEQYIRLQVKNKNCFELKTIPFRQTLNGIVLAEKQKDNFLFQDADGNSFEWILDLKESHAQKIVNEFSAALSRVGLDESEWLRRS